MNFQETPEQEPAFIKSLLREAFSKEIRNLFYIVSSLVAIGTVFYRWVEDWGWIDSFYFTVMTLTTVGYGDFVPATNAGKLFTTVFIFAGLGIVLTFVQTIAREQAKEPFFYRIMNKVKNPKK